MPDTIDGSETNVRSATYVIVESKVDCLQCGYATPVFAFAVPPGHESLQLEDESTAEVRGTWESPGMAAVLSYIEYLPERVAERIRALTPNYRIVHIDASGLGFWMNHCEHCGARMDDEALHADPNGPFGHMPDEGLEDVQLHRVHERFEAWVGGETYDPKPLDS